MVNNLRSLNGLLEALSESRKICGFRSAVEDDDQPASSYKMPIGEASADILTDIDDRVSSTSFRDAFLKGFQATAVSGCPQQEILQVRGRGSHQGEGT